MSELQSTVSTPGHPLEQSGSEHLEIRAAKPALNAPLTPAELLRELEREGFTMMGLSGKPVALETMYLRISRSKVGLGKRAWESLGSPNAVIALQKGSEKVLALVPASGKEGNALTVEWDAKQELALIRGAAWIGGVLGAGSTVAVFDVVVERNYLMVSGVNSRSANGQRNAVKADGKPVVAVARAGHARGANGQVKPGL